ncbi:5777_t:CDS:2 [Gigaspora margarita]|uniref:5777_t:CDS:1 n=1 Tax=Gigaspora margarita TaxID=4874 RepID=A0ABN7VS14_GIGMA|nr:5777_t:CDS:2 [Gigaspora margarita]
MKNTENVRMGKAKNIRESSRLKRRIIKHRELVAIDREKINSSQLQNTRDNTRAHNSSKLKINRICKGKNKEIIAESSKKVHSKEDWSMEEDLIHKKIQITHENEQDHLDEIWGIIKRAIIEAANKSLLKKKMRFIRDRLGLPIEETNKLEFNLTIKKINTDLQLEIQQAEDI